MGRLEASPQLKERIRQRYSYQCAACGNASELKADVAHLFEDATIHLPQEDTLIILCANCNEGEDRAKYKSKPPLVELFSPEDVLILARRSQRDGKYSCAYAGHRLAAYLYERHRQYPKAVACLVEAVSALRPIRWGDFLKSTLLQVERLCLSQDVGLIPRWLCLDRLALVLYDYRRWSESADVQYASSLLRARVRKDPRDPVELKLDQANSFRREALIKASTGKAGLGKLRRLLDRLLEDAGDFERRGLFDAYATNLDVASKLAIEIGKEPNIAHLYSEQALDMAKKHTHKWVLQEHYWREAEYFLLKKDKVKTLLNVIEGLRIFNNHPVVLEPTLGAAGPVPHDPIAQLNMYGFSESELREHGVAPSRNPPPERSLDLDRREIDRIVQNLMR
jgi:hypothetical protein